MAIDRVAGKHRGNGRLAEVGQRARKLLICGMRAGAMLATLAASRRDDVAGLLLFEPTISGRAYVRELTLDAELHGGHVLPSGDGIEVGEFRFNAATISQIAATDLRAISPKAGQKVAMFARFGNQADGRMPEAAWRRAGVGRRRTRLEQRPRFLDRSSHLRCGSGFPPSMM